MEQEIENADSSNGEEIVTEETPSGEETETVEELREKNKQLFARAKKAEGFELQEGQWIKKPKPVETKVEIPQQKDPDLSPKDLYALMSAQVPQEDVDEVTKAAKLLGVSVTDALKDTAVQAILEKRQTLRKSANTTNTGTSRPATRKVTDEQILAQASKGEIPDANSDEAERLFWARRGGKK